VLTVIRPVDGRSGREASECSLLDTLVSCFATKSKEEWKMQVDRTVYIHPSAVLIGKVQIAAKVFIGPNAVLRADEPGPDGVVKPIVIEEGVNIQDGVIIHAVGGTGVRIRAGASIAHGAVVHGPCEIGVRGFVGFNSVIFKTTLADGVVVMHQALVEGVDIPEGMHVPSASSICCKEDVKALNQVPQEVVAFVDKVRQMNARLVHAKRKDGNHEVK